LLFFKAQEAQALKVKEILDTYAYSTSQLINPEKCSIYFGDACAPERREEIKAALGLVKETFETKYLGLPMLEGGINKGKFQSLQAKLAKCLVEWDDTHKSQAAKEVLIKSIAQAIPLYVMSVFKLPLGLCDELTRMIRRYWSGAENGRRNSDRRTMVALAFGTCDCLTRPCLHARRGAFSNFLIPYVHKF
jgi:hypothetical protein